MKPARVQWSFERLYKPMLADMLKAVLVSCYHDFIHHESKTEFAKAIFSEYLKFRVKVTTCTSLYNI